MFWAVGCASHSPSTRHTILIFRFFFTQLRMGLRIYARGISINGARPTPSTWNHLKWFVSVFWFIWHVVMLSNYIDLSSCIEARTEIHGGRTYKKSLFYGIARMFSYCAILPGVFDLGAFFTGSSVAIRGQIGIFRVFFLRRVEYCSSQVFLSVFRLSQGQGSKRLRNICLAVCLLLYYFCIHYTLEVSYSIV